MKEKKGRIIVAMSGGVDSSVVAMMMKAEGYEVIGVTLQLYNVSETVGSGKSCCGIQDLHDARYIANFIKIPHYVINAEDDFKAQVIEPFVADYASGVTPVPCARCNRLVRIKKLVEFAKEVGARFVATGHYCKIIEGEFGQELHVPRDRSKDQTYFLYGISQAELDMLRFPLFDKTKDEVRKMAEEFGLSVSRKPDSQDICFVPKDGGYAKVVQSYNNNQTEGFGEKVGDIIQIHTGKILGKHKGLLQYTVGQRRRLGVSSSSPLYVVSIGAAENAVYVGTEDDLYFAKGVILKDVNLFPSALSVSKTAKVSVCIRALKDFAEATATVTGNKSGEVDAILVEFTSKARAPTVGQVCVIYEGTRVIGGGCIAAILQ